MEGHDDTQDRELVKITQNGRRRGGITPNGLTQTGGRATRVQMCGLTLHGNKRHDSFHRRNRIKNSTVQRLEVSSHFLVSIVDVRVVGW